MQSEWLYAFVLSMNGLLVRLFVSIVIGFSLLIASLLCLAVLRTIMLKSYSFIYATSVLVLCAVCREIAMAAVLCVKMEDASTWIFNKDTSMLSFLVLPSYLYLTFALFLSSFLRSQILKKCLHSIFLFGLFQKTIRSIVIRIQFLIKSVRLF